MPDELGERLVIRTPEGIQFAYRLAGPVSRFFAKLIDALVVLVGQIALAIGIMSLAIFTPGLGMALVALLSFLLSFGYTICLEWFWRGQTVGKYVMKLRVLDASGLHLQFNQVVVRNLLRAVDAFPLLYFVGGASCLLSRYNQRLGDLAANTIVIRRPRLGAPDLSQLMAGKYNSFREYGHLAARLRQQAGPREAVLAVEALMRRDELEPAARVALFADIADYFRSLVSFPEEATDGLSDEQYVRNVADILFRDHATA